MPRARRTPSNLLFGHASLMQSGFVLQQKLNSNGFRIPIIFISADKDLKFTEQYLKAAGAVGFLQKPLDDQSLINLVNIAVEKSSSDKIRR